MTETEWLTSEDPAAMLSLLQRMDDPRHRSLLKDKSSPLLANDRKLRLFACACRRLRPKLEWVPGNGWYENEIDGQPYGEDDNHAIDDARHFLNYKEDNPRHAALLREVVGNPFRLVILPKVRRTVPVGPWEIDVGVIDRGFSDETYCPWITPQVLLLARAAYEERPGRISYVKPPDLKPGEETYQPSRISDGSLDPVCIALLRDALLDAGCDNEEILRHLQGWEKADENTHSDNLIWVQKNRPHVRGCWVLDLLLGKS